MSGSTSGRLQLVMLNPNNAKICVAIAWVAKAVHFRPNWGRAQFLMQDRHGKDLADSAMRGPAFQTSWVVMENLHDKFTHIFQTQTYLHLIFALGSCLFLLCPIGGIFPLLPRVPYALQNHRTRIKALQISSAWEVKFVMLICLSKMVCICMIAIRVRYFCTAYPRGARAGVDAAPDVIRRRHLVRGAGSDIPGLWICQDWNRQSWINLSCIKCKAWSACLAGMASEADCQPI